VVAGHLFRKNNASNPVTLTACGARQTYRAPISTYDDYFPPGVGVGVGAGAGVGVGAGPQVPIELVILQRQLPTLIQIEVSAQAMLQTAVSKTQATLAKIPPQSPEGVGSVPPPSSLAPATNITSYAFNVRSAVLRSTRAFFGFLSSISYLS
jgi:hypothetical protein